MIYNGQGLCSVDAQHTRQEHSLRIYVVYPLLCERFTKLSQKIEK